MFRFNYLGDKSRVVYLMNNDVAVPFIGLYKIPVPGVSAMVYN